MLPVDILPTGPESRPTYEVTGFVGHEDLDEFIEWLDDVEHELPDEMGLRFRGGMYWFHTRTERTAFARGLGALL